tara:strand:+ start:3713 stop:4501 length:789 start_codon:yes stop_codon:yes gene_type:complete
MKLLFALLFAVLASAEEVKSPRVIEINSENSISFTDAFDLRYVAKKQQELFELDSKLPEGKELYIVLDTPGGSISAGNLFIDTLKSLQRPIHTITIQAASMGYNLVQSMDKRFILPSGELMSHRAAVGGLSGQIDGEVETRLSFIKRIVDKMHETSAKRVGISYNKYMNLIVNEAYFIGYDAVDKKHADEVVYLKCGKDLQETFTEVKRVLLFTFKATFSKCPLIRFPVELKTMDGKILPSPINEKVRTELRRIKTDFKTTL